MAGTCEGVQGEAAAGAPYGGRGAGGATKGQPGQGRGTWGSRERASQRHPDGGSRPRVKGKGPKGAGEEGAGQRAGPATRGGDRTERGKPGRGPRAHRRPAALGFRAAGAQQAPGHQYLDKRLHLQVEFDNLLVTDPDVDILGSRHVGDAGYGQRRWPSSNAFPRRAALRQRPLEAGPRPARVAAPSPGLPSARGGKPASPFRVVLGKNQTERKRREHQEHFHGGLSPSPADQPF